MKRKLVSYTFLSALIWGILFVPDIHSTNLTQEEQLIRVGIGAFNDGFYDIAEKQFSKFLKDYPNHLKYYDISYLLGKTLLLKGKYREAKSVFLRIVNGNKNFEYTDHTLFWLAEIETKFGNVEEARRLLLLIIKRFPTFGWIDY